MKRNQVIVVALALGLCGVFPARAEDVEKSTPSVQRWSERARPGPSGIRAFLGSALKKLVTPAETAPSRRSPLGMVFDEDDPALPPCTGVPDPSIPCRSHLPAGG